MPVQFGNDVVFELDGNLLPCRVTLALQESMELVTYSDLSVEWKKFLPNLQGYEISISGDDEGAYVFLRTLKRQQVIRGWTLLSGDTQIDFQGEVIVKTVEKTITAGQNTTYTATLLGYGAISTGIPSNDRLLEDGDLRLLEDADIRLLENAF